MRSLPLRQRIGISFGILWLLVSTLVSLFFVNIESVMTGVVIFLILGVFPVILISCLWWISEGVNWSKNKLIITITVIITVSLIIFCYAYISNASSKALLNSTWGMSEKEVKQANSEGNTKWGEGLTPLVDPDNMDGGRGVIQPRPSSIHNAKKVVWLSQGVVFLPEYGKSFLGGYYFLDNSLYGYQLSYVTDNLKEIDEIETKLTEKYGKGINLKTVDTETKAIGWVQEKQHIFFSLRSYNTERPRYLVSIEVTYLPIYNKIDK